MSVPSVLFCPPTFQHNVEVSLLALLGRFLNQHATVKQLRCNGVLLHCDRDITTSFHRSFESCLQCMSETTFFSQWSGASLEQLSKYIPSSDIERTKRWMTTVEANKIEESVFDGIAPFDWCIELFQKRFQQRQFNHENKQHEAFMRRYILSVIRTRLGVRRFLFSHKPETIFVIDSNEIFSRAVIESAQDIGLNLINLKMSRDERSIQAERWESREKIMVDVLIQDFSQVRTDIEKWPEELKEQLRSLAVFSGIKLINSESRIPMQTRVVHGR